MSSLRFFRQLRASRMATEDLIRTHGLTVAKGLAVAGIGGALFSKFMMGTVQAESKTPKRIFPGGPALFSLPLESSEDVNHNTKLLHFALPSENAISGLPLTSALLTVAWPKGSTLPVLRPYTPISPSDKPGVIDLMIKKYPKGKQSTHIHSLQPGDTLFFAVAIPGYKWTPNKHTAVTLIAGGAGITPMYQLIQGILSNPDDKTKITLVFGVNSDADVLLRTEFQGYEAQYPDQFKAVYTVSNPGAGSSFRKGYVTKELLKEVAVDPKEPNTKVMVCGPPPMEKALLGKKGWFGTGGEPGILEQLGYRKDQIHQF